MIKLAIGMSRERGREIFVETRWIYNFVIDTTFATILNDKVWVVDYHFYINPSFFFNTHNLSLKSCSKSCVPDFLVNLTYKKMLIVFFFSLFFFVGKSTYVWKAYVMFLGLILLLLNLNHKPFFILICFMSHTK